MALSHQQHKKILESYKHKKLSTVQIASDLGLSDSAVRYCLLKNNVKKRSISEAITCLHISKFNKVPFVLKKNLSAEEEKLKIIGAMLYWGEGSKRGNVVSFVNSDPEMIRVFASFLRSICGVHEKRLSATLHMYDDQNKKELEKFWSKVTGISQKRFRKTFIHQRKKGTYKRKSVYGTLALNYCDKRLLNQILSWIEDHKIVSV